MNCGYVNCTGVHNTSRYHELCPMAISKKQDRDRRYHATTKGMLKRLRATGMTSSQIAEAARIFAWIDQRFDEGNPPSFTEIFMWGQGAGDGFPGEVEQS